MIEPTVGAGGEDDEEDELGALRARHQPAPASLHPEHNNDNNRVVPYSLHCLKNLPAVRRTHNFNTDPNLLPLSMSISYDRYKLTLGTVQ